MKQLLMIEDDVSVQELYTDALKDVSVTLTGATTGKAGLESITKSPPDLIILDIMLPGGMNGFDVLEQLKKDPRYANIPVLVLTNLDSERESAMNIGATDYLVKSNTSMDDLVTKVKAILAIT